MQQEKSGEAKRPEAEGEAGKKVYQEPKLVEQGQWTDKTRPPISGSGA